MDQELTEYGKILDETLDWLEFGERRNRPEFSYKSPQKPVSRAPFAAAAEPVPNQILPEPAAPVIQEEPLPDHPDASLQDIARDISSCQNCSLFLIREHTVPGTGEHGVPLMVITPPPVNGAKENDSPLPPTEHEYLGKWLTAVGLDPVRDVFITPAVKCRTPGGRQPQTDEAAACSAYIRRQFKTIAPKALLALGGAACGALTGNQANFQTLAGQDWTWHSVPALVLWTPAEVLASPDRLRKPVWESLQRFRAAWNESKSLFTI